MTISYEKDSISGNGEAISIIGYGETNQTVASFQSDFGTSLEALGISDSEVMKVSALSEE